MLNLPILLLRLGCGLLPFFRLSSFFCLLLGGGFGRRLLLDDGRLGGFPAAAAGREDEREGGERGCDGADEG